MSGRPTDEDLFNDLLIGTVSNVQIKINVKKSNEKQAGPQVVFYRKFTKNCNVTPKEEVRVCRPVSIEAVRMVLDKYRHSPKIDPAQLKSGTERERSSPEPESEKSFDSAEFDNPSQMYFPPNITKKWKNMEFTKR